MAKRLAAELKAQIRRIADARREELSRVPVPAPANENDFVRASEDSA